MLSIVIPVWEQVPRFECMLSCLGHAVCGANAEVIVVNDGAMPEITRRADAFRRTARVPLQLVNIDRSGRSAARNAGASAASGDRLLFLDADVLAGASVIRFHEALNGEHRTHIYRGGIRRLPWLAAFSDPVAGILDDHGRQSLNLRDGNTCALRARLLTPELVMSPEKLEPSAHTPRFERDLQAWFRRHPFDYSNWLACTGAQVSIDRLVFGELGGFDEHMGMRWGAEDIEFGLRAAGAGLQIRYARPCTCYHLDHAGRGHRDDHVLAIRYFSVKHQNPGILRILDYFEGECSLDDVLEACHVSA